MLLGLFYVVAVLLPCTRVGQHLLLLVNHREEVASREPAHHRESAATTKTDARSTARIGAPPARQQVHFDAAPHHPLTRPLPRAPFGAHARALRGACLLGKVLIPRAFDGHDFHKPAHHGSARQVRVDGLPAPSHGDLATCYAGLQHRPQQAAGGSHVDARGAIDPHRAMPPRARPACSDAGLRARVRPNKRGAGRNWRGTPRLRYCVS